MHAKLMRRALALAIVVTLTPGCASVIKPYVDPPTTTDLTAGSPRFDQIPESDALRFARASQDRLQRAAHEHALMASGSGALLIPLASLIAYKGFAGGNSHNIAALATGGAAALGVTNYVYRPRDIVYLSGAAAIQCAIDTTAPSMLSDVVRADASAFSERRPSLLVTLSDAVTKGAAERANLEAAEKSLQSAMAAVATARGIDPAAAEVSRHAGRSIDEARGLLDVVLARRDALAARLVSTANRAVESTQGDREARRTLIRATQRIIGEVNVQLTNDRPDPTKLAALVPQLKLPTKPAEAATDATDASDESAAAAKQRFVAKLEATRLLGARAMEALDVGDGSMRSEARAAAGTAHGVLEAVSALNAELDAVEVALADIEASAPAAGVSGGDIARIVENCGLDKSLPKPLTIATPDGGATVVQGESLRLPIVGGTKPYAAVASSSPNVGRIDLEIIEGMGNSRTLVATASSDATTGTYVVLIQDARGGMVSVGIAVKEKPKKS